MDRKINVGDIETHVSDEVATKNDETDAKLRGITTEYMNIMRGRGTLYDFLYDLGTRYDRKADVVMASTDASASATVSVFFSFDLGEIRCPHDIDGKPIRPVSFPILAAC